ncbi:GNAT family N-acetyltransferase [Actinomadura sp. KC345]|uniref:GNAT family N-acetyltransferase n=1 Tax=Actinomadura sp. KC345 TaxID=2530371 RepID=UPI0010470D89|nr:GNAT family N-acetyltransferase [Actinomadura sp. KC345]TDC40850.1 GNAT family N-acetyltransferase [Actinomadura sp. KC345]
MDWTLSDDLDEFLAVAGGFLRDDPVRNTVALTVTENLREHGPGVYEDVLFGWWSPGGAVEGAVVRTAGYPPLLSAMPERAARQLADALAERDPAAGGASGSLAATEAFAEAWTRRTGAAPRVTMRQRLYRLGGLEAPDPPPEGTARAAGRDDRALMLEWSAAFSRDAGDHGAVNPAVLDGRLAAGRIALWEAGGRPVAMAGWSPVVAGMSRISAVYTPDGHRRRGYGAAVTAEASRAAMDAGATDVVLFTDLANPTSNAVYQRIGYRPVEDRVMLVFG